MSEEQITKDEFELKLEQDSIALQKCQTDKNLKTCFDCEALFECETRKSYVYSVYNSMSKGQQGGFEF
ncbi:hypothetical protein [Campylobacter pinnipediorum]|uniref:Uncharacterized protein n=1 Tax=Campylobacter pinnipediorum subsp. pinnipediorum TaxID=1660067 RepID=A0AAX0LBQ9_9BACT|nr:hypothetical protein [Campylobacter pinnipediorum]OPA81695.1 hypothetical protein BFG04_00710 [Campylobacter pinnipediorum subsp. pinnipediorum]